VTVNRQTAKQQERIIEDSRSGRDYDRWQEYHQDRVQDDDAERAFRTTQKMAELFMQEHRRESCRK